MVFVHDLVTDDLASGTVPVTVDNGIVQQVGELSSVSAWSVVSDLALDDRVCDGAGTKKRLDLIFRFLITCLAKESHPRKFV
mgnify:CR=1 FL=1